MSGSPLDEAKRALRLAMLRRREDLPVEEHGRRTVLALSRLQALPELGRVTLLAGFMAKGREINPAAWLDRIRSHGVAIAFPRVSSDRPRLRFHLVERPQDMQAGAFGVREPQADCPEVSLDAIDAFLVPGLAFDLFGHRVGYGGGFYDEILDRVRGSAPKPAIGKTACGLFVGLGFDFQLFDHCPAGQGDMPLDFIVTDARIVRCANPQAGSGA